MPTLNDIAKLAGVSKSTVSRYLNNGQVSSKTAAKIKKVINETGYQPNLFAQSLKAQKTDMIGVVIPRFDSPSTTLVLQGIEEVADKNNQQLLIMSSNLDPLKELDLIERLNRQRVDSIIVLTRNQEEDLLKLEENTKSRLIVIGQEYSKFNYITYDDYSAGKSLAEYGLSIGHRKFMYINVAEEDEAIRKRKSAFIETVELSGGEVQVVKSNFYIDFNYQLAHEVLSKGEASFIACATDMIAVIFNKVAGELNIKIPGDISLAGFGGYKLASYVHPTLTTTIYPYKEAGSIACQAILEGEKDLKVNLAIDLFKGASVGEL